MSIARQLSRNDAKPKLFSLPPLVSYLCNSFPARNTSPEEEAAVPLSFSYGRQSFLEITARASSQKSKTRQREMVKMLAGNCCYFRMSTTILEEEKKSCRDTTELQSLHFELTFFCRSRFTCFTADIIII